MVFRLVGLISPWAMVLKTCTAPKAILGKMLPATNLVPPTTIKLKANFMYL